MLWILLRCSRFRLFRHSSASSPLLLIYRDSPCVVIGRHQNPWTEINFATLRAAELPFIRRWSGGGAVYHVAFLLFPIAVADLVHEIQDLGNTNFSIHLPRSSFNRQITGELILRAVCSLGINAHRNERNDILVGPDKMSTLIHPSFSKYLNCSVRLPLISTHIRFCI